MREKLLRYQSEFFNTSGRFSIDFWNTLCNGKITIMFPKAECRVLTICKSFYTDQRSYKTLFRLPFNVWMIFRAKTIQERIHFCEKHATFEIAALFAYLVGEKKGRQFQNKHVFHRSESVLIFSWLYLVAPCLSVNHFVDWEPNSMVAWWMFAVSHISIYPVYFDELQSVIYIFIIYWLLYLLLWYYIDNC